MMISSLQTLLFLIVCASVLWPGLDLLMRTALTFSFSAGFYFSLFISKNKSEGWIRRWLASTISPIWANLSAFSCLLAAVFIYLNHSEPGIQVRWIHQESKQPTLTTINPDAFEILPSYFPDSFTFQDQHDLYISASFITNTPIEKLVFFLSHGEAIWLVDGIEFARHLIHLPERYLTIFKTLPPGQHRIECFLNVRGLPPTLSFSQSSNPDTPPILIKGPFSHSLNAHSPIFSMQENFIFRFLLFLIVFFLLPFLNSLSERFSYFVYEYPSAATVIGIVLCLLVLYQVRSSIQPIMNTLYEADEAAFGLMAESLLQGQSPPLLHYGQKYQGTLESFPLAASLQLDSNPARALHNLPMLWGGLFILICVGTLGYFGGIPLGLFSLLLFCIGGMHFQWIFSKTWFGYSFSLLCGALLWWITFLAYRKGRLSPGYALLWALVGSIGFYSLPLFAPFLVVTGISLVLLPTELFKHLLHRYQYSPLSLFIRIPVHLFRHFIHNGFLLAVLFLSIPLLSYLGPDIVRFLLEGRSISPPRSVHEDPFFDRFLRECLPVLLGTRASYAQSHDLPGTIFGYFPSLCFLLGILSFPLSNRSVRLFNKRLSFSLWVFALFTMFLVSYSSFGVWPWYAIPLYWVLPIILYTLLRIVWSVSPGLSLIVFMLYIIPLITSLNFYNYLNHQPLSLSISGLKVPAPFEEVNKVLKEKEIRFLICDQGYDLGDYGGRDWLGECLVYDAVFDVIAVDRLSRRIPSYAQEIQQADRVGYLFHKDFEYNNPSITPGELYAPLTMTTLSRLFGENFLNFERYEVDPYVIYLPPKNQVYQQKSRWKLDSSYPYFLSAAADQNIGVRAYGKDTFWSSDRIPPEGAWFSIAFPKPTVIQRVVVFHGTKIQDIPRNNTVFTRDKNGEWTPVGSLQFDLETHSSVLTLKQPVLTTDVRIQVEKPEDNRWWTIFELWIL